MPRKPKHKPIHCQYFIWHLRQRNGVFYADGRVNTPSLGKHSLGTRDREQALVLLHQLDQRRAVDLGLAEEDSHVTPDQRLPIEDGWDLYLARCDAAEILGGVAPSTAKRYRSVRDKHIRFCTAAAINDWHEIDKKSTNAYGSWLVKTEQLADRSIVLELNLVCSVVKWLVEEGLLPAGCQFLLKLSKPEGTSTFCYTKEQVSRMIEYCYGFPALEWMGDTITGLATTGLRINEFARLRWTDVDLPSNMIRITDERARPRRRQSGHERRIKGKRGRALPINPALRALLVQLPRHVDGLVFHGKNGRKLEDRRVLETLQATLIEALKAEFPNPEGETGFADGTVHSFRHFFASEAFRQGATEAQLVAWLGHTDSQLLRIYRHLRPEDGNRQMEKIDFLGRGDESQQPRNTA